MNTYLLTPEGVLRSLDLLKRPKGFEDPIDGKTFTELRKHISQ